MNLLLINGTIIDPVTKRNERCNVLIREGIIDKIGSSIKAAAGIETFDVDGAVIAPGFIDMHVHLREPGFEHKETIETGCEAAAEGGFTSVCCMPNTMPAIDDESVVRYIFERGRSVLGGIVNVYPIAAATKGREGKELSPIAELVAAGAVGFSDDGNPIGNADRMRNILEYSGMFGKPVIQHAEESSLTHGGCMNEGFESTRLGLPAIPREAEEIMISRDLILLRRIPSAQYHVAHISTKESIALIRAAKKEKLAVTCEATPHHFTLTEEVVAGFDTNTKMNPPLRSVEDVIAVKEGLRDGTIDVIATDHAPHTIDEKDVEYTVAPFGVVGLETAIGLAITELVEQGYLTMMGIVEKFSTRPRQILGLPEVAVREGERANITIIDPKKQWTVDVHSFRSKSHNSPFHDFVLKGKAIAIINNNLIRHMA